jgi:hypothetical protein
VSIRKAGSKFEGEDHKAWVFWMENHPEIKIDWSGQRQLIVSYPSQMGKRVEVERWQDVAVKSQEVHLPLN